jgi:hypothetical protein
MIKTFGIPHRIISDMGTSFTSEKFKAFVDEIQAIHYLTAVSMPHRSGQVERYNQAILSSAMSNLVISKARTAPILVFMFHGMKSASGLYVICSEIRNRLFCWPCLLFSEQREGPWNSTGFNNLKEIGRALQKHGISKDHTHALLKFRLFGRK